MTARKYGKAQRTTTLAIVEEILRVISGGAGDHAENPGLRPLRELVQNSDDAFAQVMTFRFDKNCLLVHNDGDTIGTEEDGTLDKLAYFLHPHKIQDPDTSGNFGSGFRSTYMFADEPEIHFCDSDTDYASGLPAGYDGITDWRILDENDAISVASHNQDEEKMGVIFRFNWRRENKWHDRPAGGRWDEHIWSDKRILNLAETMVEFAPM